ncbi:MAG: hypothetical protein AAGF89_15835 [Bacteroidota bacterium]
MAQEETEPVNEDVAKQSSAKDESKRSMVNNIAVNSVLSNGGAFYVSNPPPLMELDPEKAYLRTEWEPLVVRLMNGKTSELTGRYRLLDQKFEIKVDGELYEIYSTMISAARLGDDEFVLLPEANGTKIYQVHFQGEDYQLWSHHWADWQEPKSQNMFDTSDAKKTLKRDEDLLLLHPGGRDKVKNKKQLQQLLGLQKNGKEMKYVKNMRLDLRKGSDVTKLLEYMARSAQDQ